MADAKVGVGAAGIRLDGAFRLEIVQRTLGAAVELQFLPLGELLDLHLLAGEAAGKGLRLGGGELHLVHLRIQQQVGGDGDAGEAQGEVRIHSAVEVGDAELADIQVAGVSLGADFIHLREEIHLVQAPEAEHRDGLGGDDAALRNLQFHAHLLAVVAVGVRLVGGHAVERGAEVRGAVDQVDVPDDGLPRACLDAGAGSDVGTALLGDIRLIDIDAEGAVAYAEVVRLQSADARVEVGVIDGRGRAGLAPLLEIRHPEADILAVYLAYADGGCGLGGILVAGEDTHVVGGAAEERFHRQESLRSAQFQAVQMYALAFQ